MTAADFQPSAVEQWVAQATCLCRWATRPAERERAIKLKRTLDSSKRFSIPSGESPDGTGQWPMPPIEATEN
jgi:hypothetical protein